MRNTCVIFIVLLILGIYGEPCSGQHKYRDDSRYFEIFFSPRNFAPDRNEYDRIPVLVETNDSIYLAITKKMDTGSASRHLGGWIGIGFDARREEKISGMIMTAKVGVTKPIPEHFIQYPLDGDDCFLSFGDDRKKGKRWEWVKADGGGYYLTAIDGKYVSWVVDFGDEEEAVFKRVSAGGESVDYEYSRWPAKLAKEPGKMSRLFLKYPSAGPGVRDNPAK